MVAQGIYVFLFLKELWHLVTHAVANFSEQQIMLLVLGLIDVVMISNLLMMVIIGGYETFVSRLQLHGHPDQPEWLGHVNASVLKIKLAMAIIGISSIHLLRTFIEAGNIGIAGKLELSPRWASSCRPSFIRSSFCRRSASPTWTECRRRSTRPTSRTSKAGSASQMALQPP